METTTTVVMYIILLYVHMGIFSRVILLYTQLVEEEKFKLKTHTDT